MIGIANIQTIKDIVEFAKIGFIAYGKTAGNKALVILRKEKVRI